MRKRLLVLVALITTTLGVVSLIDHRSYRVVPPTPEPQTGASTEAQAVETPPKPLINPVTSGEVMAEVNQIRVKNGLGRLVDNGLLSQSATARADYLCDHKIWSHEGWESSLVYKYRHAGENLEHGSVFQTPRTIVQTWVESPTHYENILDTRWTEQGMGVRYCDDYQGWPKAVIVVNHFGVQ